MPDKDGQALGYFYFEDEPGRRSAARLISGPWEAGGAEEDRWFANIIACSCKLSRLSRFKSIKNILLR